MSTESHLASPSFAATPELVDAVAAGAEAELVLGVGNGALLDLAKAWPKGQF